MDTQSMGSNDGSGGKVSGMDGPSVTLTIRLIMQGKEVGSIIGKKGDNIKKFREESGAKINISDGSCPERIVTVTGPTEGILKAFSLISQKFEEIQMTQDLQTAQMNPVGAGGILGKSQVTLRLVVPASQCGSLIGKGGAKIKEIREMTGATIQVASEMLPNSTERAVTISGSSEAITKCIYQICCVMMESPPKGATIPYRPKPAMPPVIFAGGQAYTIQGQYAIPHPDLTKLHQLALQHAPLVPGQASFGALSPQAAHLATLAAAGPNPTSNIRPHHQPHPGPTASPPLAGGGGGGPSTTSELTIPNDLIGCIIGKGGAKINEIRQLSGASIKISNTEEGSKERTVVISGTPESINLATYLINTSMELHKNLTLDPNSNRDSTGGATHLNLTSTNPMAIPLTQLVPQKQPTPSSGVPVHPSTQLSHLASALPPSAAASLFSTTVVTDHHNSSYATQSRVGGKNSLVTKSRPLTGPIHGLENGGAKKADRKFAPY